MSTPTGSWSSILVIAVTAALPPAQAEPELHASAPSHVHMVVPSRDRPAVMYADGRTVMTQWESVWRPICSGHGVLDELQLEAIAEGHRQRFAQVIQPEAGEIRHDEMGGVAGGGLDIIFELDSSVPLQALDAFDVAESYIENRFDDPITVTIQISFDELPFGVLGGASSDFTPVSWTNSRIGLQDDMDDNDTIQSHLPGGSKIKVRYNANNGVVTNENRVFWTLANFNSAIGSVDGVAGDLVFNVDFNWDYDPSDGVSGYSFVDVVIHETGHILGFTAGADFRTNDMEVLDIFRFQRTDGAGDYNPDSAAEFKSRPRLVDFNAPNNQHICDVISLEYRMSDGVPYQCSHFREQFDTIGLMDPAVGGGQTLHPSFFSAADLKLFDAIGYDR